MEYKGIKYEIKIAPGPNEWVWVVHLPNPRHGSVKGSRARAVDAARRAIDTFCKQNPAGCAPPDDTTLYP